MASEKIVVNGALVLCSWTKQPVGDLMGNTANYRIYRIVTVGEVNNGIFGLDDAFLTEKDAGPYLRLDPFPVCQSPDYERALNDISVYLGDLINKSGNENERDLIRQRQALLLSLAAKAQEYQDSSRENRQNLCLLELLDHWFNCSTTLYIDNYMQKLEELINGWGAQREQIKVLVDNVKGAFEEKHGTEYKMLDPFTESSETQQQRRLTMDESLALLKSSSEKQKLSTDRDSIAASLNKYSTFCDDMKKKLSEAVYRFQLDGSNKYVDQDSDHLTDKGEALTELVDSELKRLDDTTIRGLINKYELAGEYQKLYNYIKSMKADFTPLLTNAQSLKNELIKQAVVTENSYLMCRCGGKINIIDGGQWVEEVDFKVQDDIKNILLFAEKTIYGFLKKKGEYADQAVLEDCADTRYSVIMALNGIHLLLKSMGSSGKYMNIPDSDYVKRYYPLPNIKLDLTPQNEVESQENKKAVAREVASNLPFGLNWVFNVLFFMEDMSNIYTTEESSTMKNLAKGVVEDVFDTGMERAANSNGKIIENVGNVGKATGDVKNTIKWFGLLHDLMTKSYAMFIGEIKIEINTGWDKYSFKANYDGNGNRIDEPVYKKEYMGRDMFTNLGSAQYDFEGENYMYSILGGEK